MSCAACSSRVEKAVSKVPGVSSCAVNLLTNSMNVEGTADSSAIIAAVEKAGYGASVAGQKQQKKGNQGQRHKKACHKACKLSYRAYCSYVFLHGSCHVGISRPEIFLSTTI